MHAIPGDIRLLFVTNETLFALLILVGGTTASRPFGGLKASLDFGLIRLTGRQKDSSQETIISLVGMLVSGLPLCTSSVHPLVTASQAGTIVVASVSTQLATWSTLILLLSIHIAMNHAAVRAVSMHTLNRQRANIVLSNFLANDKVLTPEEVSSQERIFEMDGVLRWKGSKILGRAKIGVTLTSLATCMASRHSVTGSIRIRTAVDMTKLVDVYRHEEYMLSYEAASRTAYIVLKEGASSTSQLKAWTHALWIAHRHAAIQATGDALDEMATSRLTEATLRDLSSQWRGCLERLKTSGWDTEVANLETTSGTRIQIHAGGWPTHTVGIDTANPPSAR